ncbi:MAG: response regulator transcription factor [Leucobacter sp.]
MVERRVLIVEDDVFVTGLLGEVLGREGFVTAHASDAASARRVADSFDPDAALIDIDLGEGPSGLDLVRAFELTRPDLVAVILTARASASTMDGLPPGVGFIRKSMISEPGALIEALDSALRRGGEGIRLDLDAQHRVDALSPSQREVLRLIALGLSNAEIARRRGVTRSGAEQAVGTVFRKLGLVHDDEIVPRVEASRLYIEAWGLPSRTDGHRG